VVAALVLRAGYQIGNVLIATSTEALRQWRARPGKAGRFFDIPINFTSGSARLSQSGDGLGITKNSDAGKSASGHR